VTVVFVSGSATIHAVQASRYVPRCRGVTGAGRSDHRSVRFGIVVLCDGHHPKTDEKKAPSMLQYVIDPGSKIPVLETNTTDTVSRFLTSPKKLTLFLALSF
jgi:hypothetical protein